MTKVTSAAIVWLRFDLRLADNPALADAIKNRHSILPVYIFDDRVNRESYLGGACRVWLHHALNDLSRSLAGNLYVECGNPLDVLSALANKCHATHIYWNRAFEPEQDTEDEDIRQAMIKQGVDVHCDYNGKLLWEPKSTLKDDGTPYKVFTHFYRKGCLLSEKPRRPIPTPDLKTVNFCSHPSPKKCISDLSLLPGQKWQDSVIKDWQIGEEGAMNRLDAFLKHGLVNYKVGRDFPAKKFVSRLSPYLHFGHISPHIIWYAVLDFGRKDVNVDHFCSELGWREFSYNLLHHNPKMTTQNLQRKFDRMAWRPTTDGSKGAKMLKAWQEGKTGIPIVDAGMRELYATGYLHNRLRMIVGSFLVKNLMIDWRHGERWFADTLFDASLANNSAGWQWVAGCGADAAPYFRIFNPVTQSARFDAEGEYTRKWVPELAKMPSKYLFEPWTAPQQVLKQAGVQLGTTYPEPIVDLSASRKEALEIFKQLKY